MTVTENDADTLPVTSDQEGFPRDHTWLLGQRWDKLSSCIQSDLNGYIAVDDIIGREDLFSRDTDFRLSNVTIVTLDHRDKSAYWHAKREVLSERINCNWCMYCRYVLQE